MRDLAWQVAPASSASSMAWSMSPLSKSLLQYSTFVKEVLCLSVHTKISNYLASYKEIENQSMPKQDIFDVLFPPPPIEPSIDVALIGEVKVYSPAWSLGRIIS